MLGWSSSRKSGKAKEDWLLPKTIHAPEPAIPAKGLISTPGPLGAPGNVIKGLTKPLGYMVKVSYPLFTQRSSIPSKASPSGNGGSREDCVVGVLDPVGIVLRD
jgi:hypothetical protein